MLQCFQVKKGRDMFNKSADVKAVLMLEGIERRTLTYGDNMLLVEFTVRAGSVFPEHAHCCSHRSLALRHHSVSTRI